MDDSPIGQYGPRLIVTDPSYCRALSTFQQYRYCTVQKWRIESGLFVLINKTNRPSIANSDNRPKIARILHIFKDDEPRALVLWYLQSSKCPPELVREVSVQFPPLNKADIILDRRVSEPTIRLRDITNITTAVEVSANESPTEASLRQGTIYVIRFGIKLNKKGQIRILPVDPNSSRIEQQPPLVASRSRKFTPQQEEPSCSVTAETKKHSQVERKQKHQEEVTPYPDSDRLSRARLRKRLNKNHQEELIEVAGPSQQRSREKSSNRSLSDCNQDLQEQNREHKERRTRQQSRVHDETRVIEEVLPVQPQKKGSKRKLFVPASQDVELHSPKKTPRKPKPAATTTTRDISEPIPSTSSYLDNIMMESGPSESVKVSPRKCRKDVWIAQDLTRTPEKSPIRLKLSRNQEKPIDKKKSQKNIVEMMGDTYEDSFDTPVDRPFPKKIRGPCVVANAKPVTEDGEDSPFLDEVMPGKKQKKISAFIKPANELMVVEVNENSSSSSVTASEMKLTNDTQVQNDKRVTRTSLFREEKTNKSDTTKTNSSLNQHLPSDVPESWNTQFISAKNVTTRRSLRRPSISSESSSIQSVELVPLTRSQKLVSKSSPQKNDLDKTNKTSPQKRNLGTVQSTEKSATQDNISRTKSGLDKPGTSNTENFTESNFKRRFFPHTQESSMPSNNIVKSQLVLKSPAKTTPKKKPANDEHILFLDEEMEAKSQTPVKMKFFIETDKQIQKPKIIPRFATFIDSGDESGNENSTPSKVSNNNEVSANIIVQGSPHVVLERFPDSLIDKYLHPEKKIESPKQTKSPTSPIRTNVLTHIINNESNIGSSSASVVSASDDENPLTKCMQKELRNVVKVSPLILKSKITTPDSARRVLNMLDCEETNDTADLRSSHPVNKLIEKNIMLRETSPIKNPISPNKSTSFQDSDSSSDERDGNEDDNLPVPCSSLKSTPKVINKPGETNVDNLRLSPRKKQSDLIKKTLSNEEYDSSIVIPGTDSSDEDDMSSTSFNTTTPQRVMEIIERSDDEMSSIISVSLPQRRINTPQSSPAMSTRSSPRKVIEKSKDYPSSPIKHKQVQKIIGIDNLSKVNEQAQSVSQMNDDELAAFSLDLPDTQLGKKSSKNMPDSKVTDSQIDCLSGDLFDTPEFVLSPKKNSPVKSTNSNNAPSPAGVGNRVNVSQPTRQSPRKISNIESNISRISSQLREGSESTSNTSSPVRSSVSLSIPNSPASSVSSPSSRKRKPILQHRNFIEVEEDDTLPLSPPTKKRKAVQQKLNKSSVLKQLEEGSESEDESVVEEEAAINAVQLKKKLMSKMGKAALQKNVKSPPKRNNSPNKALGNKDKHLKVTRNVKSKNQVEKGTPSQSDDVMRVDEDVDILLKNTSKNKMSTNAKKLKPSTSKSSKDIKNKKKTLSSDLSSDSVSESSIVLSNSENNTSVVTKQSKRSSRSSRNIRSKLPDKELNISSPDTDSDFELKVTEKSRILSRNETPENNTITKTRSGRVCSRPKCHDEMSVPSTSKQGTPRSKIQKDSPDKKEKDSSQEIKKSGKQRRSKLQEISPNKGKSTPKKNKKSTRKNVDSDDEFEAHEMPGREQEMNHIQSFIEKKIQEKNGGCMYISGVPGTGKTASVTQVVRLLKERQAANDLPEFKLVKVSGMELTQPQQVFSRILDELLGLKMSYSLAQAKLNQYFSNKDRKRPSTVLIIDELDILCTRRQDIVYSLFDWPAKVDSRLIVLAIANTMDLPERMLKGRVTSRLGLTRIVFHPYNFEQLQTIVKVKLASSGNFQPDAMQLAARKVASVSGDARRALDICRRAADLAGEGRKVEIADMMKALDEMCKSPVVAIIKSCSSLMKYFLTCLMGEMKRTGISETTFEEVYNIMMQDRLYNNVVKFHMTQVVDVCSQLSMFGLINTEDNCGNIKGRISLCINTDDLHFALQCN